MLKKLFASSLSLFAMMAMADAQTQSAEFAKLISLEGLKNKLTILAGPEMEGRETASPGQKKAAAFIEQHFKTIGLQPGNGESYQQQYPLFQDQIGETSFKVNGKHYQWDKDYAISLQGLTTGSWENTEMVFAGYGIIDSARKINDYLGLDVKGKFVMVLEGGISNTGTANNIASRGMNMANMTKIAAARKFGAIGVIMISAEFPRKNPTATTGRLMVNLPAPSNNAFISVSISEELGSALLGSAKTNIAAMKDYAKGKYQVDWHLLASKKTAQLESSNVIGLLPGTDKKDEYVFVTSHYDHLGKQGNVIYYGADDDGSGTVGVMQMAEAFSIAAKKGI